MIEFHVTTNLDKSPWNDLRGEPFGQVSRIGLLTEGTTSGNSVVALAIKLPDGSHVMGQTTLVLMVQAIQVLQATDKAHRSRN